MNVKYVKGPNGKFRGSLPKGRVAPILPPTLDSTFDEGTNDDSEADGIVDVWVAYERSKRTSTDTDAVTLAEQAIANYRRRASESMSQDDLYEAQEAFHSEIAAIPLGRLETNLDAAWWEYQNLEGADDTSNHPDAAPHGWLLAVAASGRSSEALKQAWCAAEELAHRCDDADPRLDTADAVRMHLLEFNPRTPAEVFESAYDENRLSLMQNTPESDYADHLVRLPVSTVSLPRSLRENVARRLAEWAEASMENAEDIDDAARGIEGGDSPRIPVFLTDIDSAIAQRYVTSPSNAIAKSCAAAEEGFRLTPRKA
jgi:hypothetical protein